MGRSTRSHQLKKNQRAKREKLQKATMLRALRIAERLGQVAGAPGISDTRMADLRKVLNAEGAKEQEDKMETTYKPIVTVEEVGTKPKKTIQKKYKLTRLKKAL